MASSAVTQLACLVLMVMVVASPLVQATISCGQVSSALAPCTNYLRNGGVVPAACCNGVKSLNGAAKTTPDRQATCRCLQSAASSIKGLNLNLAGGLPGQCGVNIPYKISPSTNCNSVQ